MTYEQKQMVNESWKRISCGKDPIFTMLDKDMAPTDNVRKGILTRRRTLHKYIHQYHCSSYTGEHQRSIKGTYEDRC
ncbi:Os11g0620450 [Oryza sativa Japonica Group]|uniref:Os11g0620450 protein n=1 Tax=Oryza sativa subsp. japonica TaxID=39947 RepID=A0A0P0Y4J2_ORYSJ|nr:hypothetical protein EE612_056690 [Oryza sativa]BAT14903.1 Os11g0620450 [Oryza sativa Japonica Group]